MYYTGRRYGLSVQDGFDPRFDPAAATRANGAYINDHLRIFNNDLELVLGAYNGGEGRMQRLSNKGAKRFWDPAVFNRLPPEERRIMELLRQGELDVDALIRETGMPAAQINVLLLTMEMKQLVRMLPGRLVAAGR